MMEPSNDPGLNRVTQQALGELRKHLAEMMQSEIRFHASEKLVDPDELHGAMEAALLECTKRWLFGASWVKVNHIPLVPENFWKLYGLSQSQQQYLRDVLELAKLASVTKILFQEYGAGNTPDFVNQLSQRRHEINRLTGYSMVVDDFLTFVYPA